MKICPICDKEHDRKIFCSDKCRCTHNNKKRNKKRRREKYLFDKLNATVNKGHVRIGPYYLFVMPKPNKIYDKTYKYEVGGDFGLSKLLEANEEYENMKQN